MASPDRVNLLEAFEQQVNNNYIFLTTFTFDPVFFDTVILDSLRRDNPYAEIFIFVDAGTYQAKYDEFTTHTGTDYHLVPVSVPAGFFHPKVQLFVSESEEAATILTGSANLTLTGLTQNLEAVTKLELDLSGDLPPTVDAVVEFFRGISTDLADDVEFQEVLEDLTGTPFFDREKRDQGDLQFLSNREAPILTRLSAGITATEFEEVKLTAPFLSNNASVVSQLVEEFTVDRVVVLLQEGNHNLETTDAYRALAEAHDITFELRKVNSEDNRYLHAKLLALNGETSYLLIGSPNMTAAALQKDWDRGNVEAGFVIRGSSLELFEELDEEPVTDEAAFLADTTADFRGRRGKSVRITTAKYDDSGERLLIQTEERTGTAELTVRTRDPKQTATTTIDLSNSEHEFHIAEGIPTEVRIRYGDKTGRRRVFYDEDQIFKRARRSSNSLQELSDSFDERGAMDLSDLVFVFRSLNDTLDQTDDSNLDSDGTGAGGQPDRGPSTEKFHPPSRGSGSAGGFDPLLRKLSQAYDAIRTKREQEQELEQVQALDESESPTRVSEPDGVDQEQYDKRIQKIIREATTVLSRYAERADEQAETWLEGQHLLLRFFLLLIGPATVSEEVFETLESQLDENLENLEYLHEAEENFDPKVKRRFFTYLLIYNLLNRHTGREEYRPSIGSYWLLRHLYSYDELVTAETYYSVKDQTQSMLDTQLDHIDFDIQEFRETYSSLAAGSIGTKTTTDDISAICREMVEEDDEEFAHLQRSLLYVLADKFYIGRRLRKRLRNIDAGADEDSAAVIEYLLAE